MRQTLVIVLLIAAGGAAWLTWRLSHGNLRILYRVITAQTSGESNR